MIRSSITALFILFVTALGCAERVDDSDDRTAELREDLRLDANTEDFPTIGRLFVSPRGEIAVPLPQDRKLAVYDSSGKRIRTLGRPGPGPGEFQGIGGVGWIADTIWVNDPRVRRTTYFAPDGTVLRVIGLPASLAPLTPAAQAGALMRVSVIAVFADGSSLSEGTRLTSRGSGRAVGEHVIVRMTPTGEWRVLAIPPSFEDERWSMSAAGFGRQVPFTGWPLFATSSDGRWFATLITDSQAADGGTYTLSVFKANGDTVFVRAYPFRGVSIPRSVADSAVAAENRGPSSEGPSNLGAMFERIARDKMPPVYAPVQWFILGLDDTIWITLRDSVDARTTVVLDARGDQIGRVVTSTRTRIRQASASRMWATEIDDDGLASVVRYRVHGIPCRPPGCQE